jgi:hypothetical protein
MATVPKQRAGPSFDTDWEDSMALEVAIWNFIHVPT